MAYIASNLRMAPLMGLGATYNDDTPCGAIPAGDPYRSPGHWCMYAGQMLQFDDQGQVHPDPVSQQTTVGPASPSIVDSVVKSVPGGSTTLLIAGAALGAWLMFGGKKKGRR